MDNIGYTGAPGATGEMMEACLALGADTVDIDIPWLTPTVEKDRNVLVTAMMLAGGAILVDSNTKTRTGKRYLISRRSKMIGHIVVIGYKRRYGNCGKI